MVQKSGGMQSQIQALKKNDLGPIIRMAGIMLPRLLNGFLPKLNEKQRKAFDKVMPVGGEKKIFIHLVDTPTKPIVIGFAQPMTMNTKSEAKVKEGMLKGVKLKTDDLLLVADGLSLGKLFRMLWRLKGQWGNIWSIAWNFMPIIRLGPAELKDLIIKATSHFKPLLDLLPKP